VTEVAVFFLLKIIVCRYVIRGGVSPPFKGLERTAYTSTRHSAMQSSTYDSELVSTYGALQMLLTYSGIATVWNQHYTVGFPVNMYGFWPISNYVTCLLTEPHLCK